MSATNFGVHEKHECSIQLLDEQPMQTGKQCANNTKSIMDLPGGDHNAPPSHGHAFSIKMPQGAVHLGIHCPVPSNINSTKHRSEIVLVPYNEPHISRYHVIVSNQEYNHHHTFILLQNLQN